MKEWRCLGAAKPFAVGNRLYIRSYDFSGASADVNQPEIFTERIIMQINHISRINLLLVDHSLRVTPVRR